MNEQWKLVPVEPTEEMEYAIALAVHRDARSADVWAAGLAAAPQPPVGDAQWSYCPECGSDEIHHAEAEHKQCANCHQEWFSDIDYSDTVRHHLGGHYGNWKSLVTARDQQLAAQAKENAELRARVAGLEKERAVIVPSMNMVMEAYEYANDHPHKYLRGTTNWCEAVAWSLRNQIISAYAELSKQVTKP